MQTIKQSYIIHSPVDEVWAALVDQPTIEEWSGDPAVMDDQEGTEFSLWNGKIHGTNLEVITHERLVQEWYGGEWPEPSIVQFMISPHGIDETRVELTHENVPDEEADEIDHGWDEYYLGAIKEYLEE